MGIDGTVAAIGALLGAQTFIMGFSSVRDRSMVDHMQARLESAQDRLRDAAERDDSFPVPYQLESIGREWSRINVQASESVGRARLLTWVFVALVLALSVWVVWVNWSTMTSLELAIVLALLAASLVVAYVGRSDEIAIARDRNLLRDQSALAVWDGAASAMDDGDAGRAAAGFSDVLDLMPEWPWAQLGLLLATASFSSERRLHPDPLAAGLLRRMSVHDPAPLGSRSDADLVLLLHVSRVAGDGDSSDEAQVELARRIMDARIVELNERLNRWQRRT